MKYAFLLLLTISVYAEDKISIVEILFATASHAIITNHTSLTYMAFGAGKYDKSEELALECASNVESGLSNNLKVFRLYCKQNGVNESDKIPGKIIRGYALTIEQAKALRNLLKEKTEANNAKLIESWKSTSEFIEVELHGKKR